MNYREEAKRIIEIIKSDFLLSNGALGLERENGILSNHDIFADLGDYLPFILYFGENNFIDNQIKVLKKRLKDYLLVSDFKSFHIGGLAKSYEHTDLLLGLSDYYLHRKNQDSLELLKKVADAVINKFRLDGEISSFYHYKSHINLPIFDTRDGTFIEIYTELSKTLNDERYLHVAHNIFNQLESIDFYKKTGLLPVYHSNSKIIKSILKKLGINKFDTAVICKNNTNSVLGILTYYVETKNERALIMADNILSSIIKYASVQGGGISATASFENENNFASLTHSFHTIDCLCYIYDITKKSEYLDSAMKIADYWIKLQGKTGLFPLNSNGVETFIDSETDMTASLLALAELTKNDKYAAVANKCFEGLIKYHGERNYILGVDMNTGEPINTGQRTKFITLFLKDLILMEHLDKGGEIYKNKELWSLLRDR